jgi:hypothetical protein
LRFILRWYGGVLLASALLAACAAPPSQPEPAVTRAKGIVDFGVNGALPLVHTRQDPLIASRLGVGQADARLRYDASYTMEPGDLFAETAALPGAPPPQRLAGQKVDQNFRMRLPPLAGAPVALRYSTQAREHWTLSGDRSEQQRQLAHLDWAPRMASLNLQWAGNGAMTDSQLALGCDLLGTVRVPLHTAASNSHALRISGRDCRVLTSDQRYAALAAETWGIAWGWKQAERDTEILLSVIDPNWKTAGDRQPIDPSYEFGVSHRQDHGDWSARTSVAMRHITAWDLSAPIDASGHYSSDPDSFWTASASLTRHLPAVSVSATWAHSADPMWFMPEIGQRKHRLDMQFDLSRAVAPLLPDATPQLAMHWNWSQVRTRNDAVTDERAVRINMAILW